MNPAQKQDFKKTKTASKDFLDLYILSWIESAIQLNHKCLKAVCPAIT